MVPQYHHIHVLDNMDKSEQFKVSLNVIYIIVRDNNEQAISQAGWS